MNRTMATATSQNNNSNNEFWHGKVGSYYQWWEDPVQTLESSRKARPEYTAIEAHEYQDCPQVLEEKISLLAVLIQKAKHCIAYTGAGLSVSSGLDDYASDRCILQQSQPRGSGITAQPNDGHKALVRLRKAGFLQAVVNQNHDGLLQKAGFPQCAMNEIHGSFFDPSNPGGNVLRNDLFDNLLQHEASTDLCLALGTSLSGLNADRIAKTAASRSGLVICNLQRTQLDGECYVRIFAPLDLVLAKLADRLELPKTIQESNNLFSIQLEHNNDYIFQLPYDPKTGEHSNDKTCQLELSIGSRIRVAPRGSYANCLCEVVEVPLNGTSSSSSFWKLQIHQRIHDNDNDTEAIMISDEHYLGFWWIAEAQKGCVPFLPVVPFHNNKKNSDDMVMT